MHFGTFGQMSRLREGVAIGKLAGAGILTLGEVFFVKDGGDADFDTFTREIPKSNWTNTIANAITAARANMHDYIVVAPKSTSGGVTSFAESLSVNKEALHIVGSGRWGSKPIIRNIDVLSDACEIGNVHLETATSSAQIPLEIGSTGNPSGTYVHDCRIAAGTSSTAAADAKDAGVDTLFENCVLGSAITHDPADVYLQNMAAKRARFIDCVFYHKAAAAGDQFCTLIAASGVNVFDRCCFANAAVGTTDMTVGIVGVADGEAFLHYCTMMGVTTFTGTGLGRVAPTANAATAALTFNPCLAIDAVAPVVS
jgi:hypothetical protein